MGVINAAALVILGFLLLRKIVSMERYFEVRVYLITAFLCGLLLFALSYMMAEPDCFTPPPSPDVKEAFLCSEF